MRGDLDDDLTGVLARGNTGAFGVAPLPLTDRAGVDGEVMPMEDFDPGLSGELGLDEKPGAARGVGERDDEDLWARRTC